MKRMVSIFLLVMCLIFPMSFAHDVSHEGLQIDETLERQVMSYVKEQVVKSYSQYYDIPEINVAIEQLQEQNEVYEVSVFVSFKKILKAKSAYDLPYIQGLLSSKDQYTSLKETRKAEAYIESLVNELETLYIGQEQGETAHFELRIPKIATMSLDAYEMFFVGEFDVKAPMSVYAPASERELQKQGALAMQNYVSKALDHDIVLNGSAKDYNRINARDYIRKWTDSCGGCHCSSCKSTAKYNPAYVAYHNNDCANYVSQAIYAGGIQQDTTWAPKKIAWINTGRSTSYYGLTEYMVDQGYFFKTTDKMKTGAGSIISWTGFSHVGMIDQNDTVTMTYCAHTNDRYQSSFKNLSGVEFFVPVWDSYGNQWTPR